MLVHVDPAKTTCRACSFPSRDLRVDVKGFGKQKLNAAMRTEPGSAIRTISH